MDLIEQTNWFTIEPMLLKPNSPVSIEDQSSHYVREVYEKELFPNRESQSSIPVHLYTLNLAYYPHKKGPYNFDVDGTNADGSLKYPDTRWGGIMRPIQQPDFERDNIEYIEFWLMDPFVEDLPMLEEIYF